MNYLPHHSNLTSSPHTDINYAICIAKFRNLGGEVGGDIICITLISRMWWIPVVSVACVGLALSLFIASVRLHSAGEHWWL
jgi:hypothetical protein